jgi:hypothetical protein
MDRLQPLPPAFGATVAALHTVAEQIVAPARKPANEIALEATPGGFGTPPFDHDGVEQQVRVDGVELVHATGGEERRTALTSLEAARRLVAGLVPDGPLSGEPLDVDPDAAARLADWYATGDAVLRQMGGVPVLWPEHFDIAIDLGEATYGFSPGDEQHPEPYAYVLPWNPVAGELWQATGFPGAELSYSELLAAPDPGAAALDFFTTRKEALA